MDVLNSNIDVIKKYNETVYDLLTTLSFQDKISSVKLVGKTTDGLLVFELTFDSSVLKPTEAFLDNVKALILGLIKIYGIPKYPIEELIRITII